MKWFKTGTLLLALISTTNAYSLDEHDVGEYVLLNKQQEPTSSKMRFYQNGTQWQMDAKHGDENWQTICDGHGPCRLEISSEEKIQQWKQLLPSEIRHMPMECIDNIAFAFCRISKPDNPNQRLYWWFAWKNEKIYALGLNRIR